MIQYKYNLINDINHAFNTIRNFKWFKKQGLVFFWPTPFRMIRLILNRPKVSEIDIKEEIVCYWVSSGTWGSYSLPNQIYICPWQLTEDKIAEIILHEIKHLYNEDKVRGMTHEEKEKFIDNLK